LAASAKRIFHICFKGSDVHVPSNKSKVRLRKAFNEGRRSATVESAQNPYDNPKLQKLWEDGRAKQKAGELKDAIPPLEPGETRAQKITHNPPGSAKPPARRPAPPRRFGGPGRDGPGFGGPGRDGPGRSGPGNSSRWRPR